MLTSNLFRTQISILKREVLPKICLRSIKTETERLPNEEENAEESTNKGSKKIRPQHPLSTCLKYMESKAYKTTYGDKPVWHVYVRNFKGALPPETRKFCVTSKGLICTGNPCPICRDEYLLPHYQNIKLLEQFVSPFGGEIIPTKKTGVCQKQHMNLIVAIKKAQNYGLMKFSVPHRHYDYSLYNKK